MLLGHGCSQLQAMRSSTALCGLDCTNYARAHVTALKTHGPAGEAMAARATWALQANEECARLLVHSTPGSLGSSAIELNLVSSHSIAGVLNRSTLALERTNKDQIGSLLNSTL